MAYSTSNPPRLDVQGMAGYGSASGRGRIWTYASTDAISVVMATNYFTNAADLGMMTGDVVQVNETDTLAIAWSRVMAVTATGTILSTGLNIT